MSLLEVGAIECGLHNSAEAFEAAVTYTKNLGSLLNVVLSHVEAVQMIDLTLLIRHVSQVTPTPASALPRLTQAPELNSATSAAARAAPESVHSPPLPRAATYLVPRALPASALRVDSALGCVAYPHLPPSPLRP